MRRIPLCSGLLLRAGAVLLVRCMYDGESEALWTLPGGRQEERETIPETVVREFQEEASLTVDVGELAYVSESFDDERALHVINCTFFVEEPNGNHPQPRSIDPKVFEARFVPLDEAPELLQADVLRIPVTAALSGAPHGRYFAFRNADVSVPFFGRRNAPHA